MKRRNVLAALAILGVTAAATTPAMALENEFHGMFQAQYINSNFNGAATTSFPGNNAASYGGDTQYVPFGQPKHVYSANFVEQRARLGYTAKASSDLKLVTQFELDYAYWGDSSYGTHRNHGGAIGADQTNIETKNIYLDANIFKDVNMRLGMMPYNDSFKSIMFDADMAGIAFSSSYNKFTPTIGFFRFNDTGNNKDNVLGHMTNDLFVLDGKYEVNKDLKVGAAYYFFRNNADTIDSNAVFTFNADGAITTQQDVKLHTLGLNAEYTAGPLTLNGFGILEVGTVNARATTAYALNAGAKYKVGSGKAHAEFLYVSGDSGTTGHSNAFYAVFNNVGTAEHGYYDNEMVILGRDKNAMTTDNSIIATAGNFGQGQIGGYIGYELPLTDRLTTAANAGFAAVAKDNGAFGKAHKSNYLGTEINAEANYKLLENLTGGVRVAYVFLGDYYKGVALNGETPVNPYDAKIIFKYSF
ncbi:hypothetical protein F6V30_04365 [Oryzomonas sagensis]|uniref:Uncharacterized protein n=1 Tax=Oryzomonas sagensis TaxID=2603857 RepID=A0ABQ6TS21_9BACT|nr:hypothetical protein [Oryzomonas sagensis]KAB0671820.1 hypothetical protein F6V30_04365 [Oryzomonas sagensis]